MATENYNFVVPTGDTLVAPLTQEFENWNSVDNILKTISDSAVYSATELYSLTVHAITRSKADAALFRFTAVSKYTAGDTFTVDGVAVTALLPTGEALSDSAFVIGSEVLCCLKGTLLTVYTTNAIPETVENATKLNGQSANYYATAESVDTINNNLGFIYTYYVGSSEQEFKTGNNELTVKTKIPAGVYLFIINGVHEPGADQKLPTDEYIVVNDIRERIYSGSNNLQANVTYSTGVTDNPVIGLMLRTDRDFITYSMWHILAIRLK